jgi:hypothetical protein
MSTRGRQEVDDGVEERLDALVLEGRCRRMTPDELDREVALRIAGFASRRASLAVRRGTWRQDVVDVSDGFDEPACAHSFASSFEAVGDARGLGTSCPLGSLWS